MREMQVQRVMKIGSNGERCSLSPLLPIFAALCLFTLILASCSPGHDGREVITFVRDGQLWTIDPNGANAFAIVSQGQSVVGYSLAPTHQWLAFRTLDENFAKTAASKQRASNPLTGQVGDIPTSLNVVGIDGGSPIPVTLSKAEVLLSNAIWNTTGKRMVYRQTFGPTPSSPTQAYWIAAQNDQPVGIAAKTLPASYSIPSIDYTSSLTLWNSDQGLFTTTIAGTDERILKKGMLPGHPLPASLERALWQPGQGNTPSAILYAVPSTGTSSSNNKPLEVQLMLLTPDSQTTTLATCTCSQFAWAPDGNHILYSTGAEYTIVNIKNKNTFTVAGEPGSVPYWSPDARFLLLDGTHTLTLIQVASQQQQVILSDGQGQQESAQSQGQLPATNALLQPVANNVWAADSQRFVFLTRDRLSWQGHTLSKGKGLYVVTLDNAGKVQQPSLIDQGNDTQIGWTYQDANTSFLF